MSSEPLLCDSEPFNNNLIYCAIRFSLQALRTTSFAYSSTRRLLRRPAEVELLIGDPTKAMTKLGWKPKYDLEALCSEMVKADVDLFKRDQLLKNAGFEIKNEFE